MHLLKLLKVTRVVSHAILAQIKMAQQPSQVFLCTHN